MRLAVRLTPRGGRDAVEGWATGADGRSFLKARVAAPPVEGEANAGQTGRLKQVEVEGLDHAALTAAFGPQPGA
jgi:uncharacterized protein YggU (UPF0235/DUF167 family)